ncbi:MAG: response regulator transcription factor [Firmicutes bacterium]|jgi:DNA-binding response OmpR family regulator|nr:response regulator transcription factor [Bacillota bacterium]
MEKLLIVEDDKDLREGLEFAFRSEGYEVLGADRVEKARARLRENACQGIILDCGLPDGNGFDFCQEIRKNSEIPILMLTARDSELDEVKALELGVSDYMSKPFSVAVLKARVKKMLKAPEYAILESGSIRMNLSACKVEQDRKEIALSAIEFKLLTYFLRNKGLVLSKEQILEQIWEKDGQFVDDNIVSVNITRLRKKIETDPKHPQRLKTVHGMGYIWKEDTL